MEILCGFGIPFLGQDASTAEVQSEKPSVCMKRCCVELSEEQTQAWQQPKRCFFFFFFCNVRHCPTSSDRVNSDLSFNSAQEISTFVASTGERRLRSAALMGVSAEALGVLVFARFSAIRGPSCV